MNYVLDKDRRQGFNKNKIVHVFNETEIKNIDFDKISNLEKCSQ